MTDHESQTISQRGERLFLSSPRPRLEELVRLFKITFETIYPARVEQQAWEIGMSNADLPYAG